MKNFETHKSSELKATALAILSSIALAASGCGGDKTTPSHSKVIDIDNNNKPHAEGQAATSIRFYPDGTAISRIDNKENFALSNEVATHYSCLGTNLQIVSESITTNGLGSSSALNEDSSICADSKVTPADFHLNK